MAELTVVGLGPGREGLITEETWDVFRREQPLFLRTCIHPTVKELRSRKIPFSSYDSFYEEAEDFASLYEAIAKDLLARAEKGPLTYAVPGSPFVAERTVVLLRELSKGRDVTLHILPAMSFVEVLCARLALDPVEGLTILDASDVEGFLYRMEGRLPHTLLVTQVYSPHVASDLKLALMDHYGDEARAIYLHSLALPDESVREIPLYELDRQQDIDHLTSLVVYAKSSMQIGRIS